MEMAIKDLLAEGAVREVRPQDEQFTSTLFLVQKENGDYRPIINIRALNRFLGKESFKMEGLQLVKSLIQQRDFMMKFDLKDAYYALPGHHSHRKYLRFIYQEVSRQNIRVSVPSLWPVLSSVSNHKDTEASAGSVVVDGYPGCDLYRRHVITPPTEQGAAENLCSSGRLLEKLGFLVKREKCSPIPCQHLVFLGAVLDSITMTLCLPQPKLTSIVDTCHQLLAQGSDSMRTLSTLIGQMSHASQTGILVAPLHYRGLQRL